MLACAAVVYSSCSINQATRHGRLELHGCSSDRQHAACLHRTSLFVTPQPEPATTHPTRPTTHSETATVILGYWRGRPITRPPFAADPSSRYLQPGIDWHSLPGRQ